MKVLLKIALLVMSGCVSGVALGCSQTNNSIGMMGLDHASGNIHVNVLSSAGQCSCASIRFVSASTNTEMVLSILMAAKLAEKLVRIDFLEVNNCNSAFRVYIQ